MKVYFIMDSIVDGNRNLERLKGITCLIELRYMVKARLNPRDLSPFGVYELSTCIVLYSLVFSIVYLRITIKSEPAFYLASIKK